VRAASWVLAVDAEGMPDWRMLDDCAQMMLKNRRHSPGWALEWPIQRQLPGRRRRRGCSWWLEGFGNWRVEELAGLPSGYSPHPEVVTASSYRHPNILLLPHSVVGNLPYPINPREPQMPSFKHRRSPPHLTISSLPPNSLRLLSPPSPTFQIKRFDRSPGGEEAWRRLSR
jgi:hypothetical protein